MEFSWIVEQFMASYQSSNCITLILLFFFVNLINVFYIACLYKIKELTYANIGAVSIHKRMRPFDKFLQARQPKTNLQVFGVPNETLPTHSLLSPFPIQFGISDKNISHSFGVVFINYPFIIIILYLLFYLCCQSCHEPFFESTNKVTIEPHIVAFATTTTINPFNVCLFAILFFCFCITLWKHY